MVATVTTISRALQYPKGITASFHEEAGRPETRANAVPLALTAWRKSSKEAGARLLR